MNDAMDRQFQPLLQLLDQLSDEFVELRDGVRKAIMIADHDPEMALTRTRKVLEYIVREVYGRRYFNILCDEFGEKRFNKSKLV